MNRCARPPDADDSKQYDQVEDSDDPEEDSGDTGAHDAAEVLPFVEARLDSSGGDGKTKRQSEHDGGVAQREEEADSERLLAPLEHEPGGVVDRGNVVGIKGVA
jgi:hypothetical protein